MNKKKFEIADRKDYSVYVIPENVNVYDFLNRNHPFKIVRENIFIVRNKKSRLCYLFNKKASVEGKILSSRYIANRYRKFSGKIFFRCNGFVELLDLNRGEVQYSELVDSTLPDCKIVYGEEIKAISKKDLYYRTSKYELLQKVLGFIALSVILSTSLVYMVNKVKISNESIIAHQKELELLEQHKVEENKRKSGKLLELKNKYENKFIVQNTEIYPIINLIYDNLTSDCVIENLNIHRTDFQIDITTKNAIEILSRLETNPRIEKIQMNRTASSSGLEHVSFSGKIKKVLKVPLENESVDSKILFYEELLAEPKREFVFSEYAKNIRSLIVANKCKEEFLQVRNIDGLIDLECELKGSGINILNLIKAFDDYESKIEIKNIRIRNAKNTSLCNLNVVFETFIDVNSLNKSELENTNIKEASPNEIGVVFRSRMEQTNSKPKIEAKHRNIIPEKQIKSRIAGKLDLLGKGANKDYEKIIFLKNSVTGEILKVPVVKSEIEDNYALESIDEYVVYINKEEYKVTK